MGLFSKRKKEPTETAPAGTAVQTGSRYQHPFGALGGSVPAVGDLRLYQLLRESVPVIDSAVSKIVRLMGGFSLVTGEEETDKRMREFFSVVRVGPNQTGIQAFADTYMEQLLTCGSAIGEMLYDEDGFYGLYNGALDAVEVRLRENGLSLDFYNVSSGVARPVAHGEKLLFSVINPEPGRVYGTSLLRGLPFVSDILLKIYACIGMNWERAGNVRYAITYIPQSDGADRASTKERATQMAEAWRDAMSTKDSIKDFVAVGDVKVRVIGADNQVMDSEVPVRQMLEQIIAKTGLMPYMFGLNWSTSERMARQQTDILTTELEAYRRTLTPVLKKIADTYLAVNGYDLRAEVVWDDITLQDQTEIAEARLKNAHADKLLKEAEA